MAKETPRLGLNTYNQGDTDWDHTDAVEAIDERAIVHGDIADRPAEGDYDDELYHAIDQGITWRWDADAADWKYFAGRGSSTSPVPGTTYLEAVRVADASIDAIEVAGTVDGLVAANEKGVADGVAELDSNGTVASSQVPDLAITRTHSVSDEAERLALAVEEGDIAVQTDTETTYIFTGGDPSVSDNWTAIVVNVVDEIDGEVITPNTVDSETIEADSLQSETIEADSLQSDTIEADSLQTGTIEAGSLQTEAIENTDYRETAVVESNAGTSYDASLSDGNVHKITLTNDCTVTLSGTAPETAAALTLVVEQDSSGGHEVTWGTTILWPSSNEPTVSDGAGDVDRYVFTFVDGDWYGSPAGYGFGEGS